MDDVFLSIVIPTLGRKKELRALLESITKSEIVCKYETLIIDQNESDFIDDICEEFKEKMNLVQYKVHFKGLSKAKNYGIEHSGGNIICFPDDDSEMTDDTVKNALNFLYEKNADCVFGKCVDKRTGKDSVIRFQKDETRIMPNNLDGTFIEATMFAKKDVFVKVKYDETMGVGEIFGSQEGFDLVYRLLIKNKKMFYNPAILFYHPNKIMEKDTREEIKRAFYYSCGFGYLCKKHKFKDKYKARLRKLKIGILLVAIIRHKELKYYKAQLMGIQLGYDYLS